GPRCGARERRDEARQRRPGVVRARARLGVVLHRGDWHPGQLDALDRAVVERYVRNPPAAEARIEVATLARRADGEAVVLGRHEHPAGVELEHRMVRAAVAEAELERL